MALEVRNTTVLVTGASAGLGVEFARRFAARGANLVLVARRADRLETLAAEIRSTHSVEVTVLPEDLSVPGVGARLKADLDDRGITVGSVVNNAGYGSHGAFSEADPTRMIGEIQLNVGSLAEISRAFMPDLLAGHGALVNIASTAAFQPTPGMAVYGATKAFVLNFTEALWFEARGTELTVLAVCPGPTKTEFFDVVGTEDAAVGRMQTAEQVVAASFSALDRKSPPPSVVSGVANWVSSISTRMATRRLGVLISGRILGNVRMKVSAGRQ
ncbi:SDR family NAD(P)-dependent oxidoreductase [Rhodococcus sp. P1Y]|uniref:SDR family NAD(P)-dependent oxidoreductase n=1 Tax=Rhodococcus sp. P1Y TaxID=1302308 RepID=UPI000EB3BE95|nr:SDR family oxidoreductase [Rhodococcus sp. P1Y]AYJ47874.1 SDR family oxidoreductase [Rhodococcus sp. P1Y]